MIKKLLTIALTLLFLERGFHFDYAYHKDSSTYSICKEGCDNKSCFSSIHNCKECLNENNRFIVLDSSNHLTKQIKSTVLSFKHFVRNSSFLIGSSGRSPPQAL